MAGVPPNPCHQCGGCENPDGRGWVDLLPSVRRQRRFTKLHCSRLDRTPATVRRLRRMRTTRKPTWQRLDRTQPSHERDRLVLDGNAEELSEILHRNHAAMSSKKSEWFCCQTPRPLDNRTARSYRRRHLVLMLARALPIFLMTTFVRRFPQGVVHGRPILPTHFITQSLAQHAPV